MARVEKLVALNDAEKVLAHTPFLLTRCSADLRYLFVTEAYARMIGRSARDIVGREIRDVMGERGFATILPHIEKVLSGERVEYETKVHFEQVGERLLHVVYTPEADAPGRVAGWIASIVDITEKREAQQRIAADDRAMEALRAAAACVCSTGSSLPALDQLLEAAIDIAGAAKGNLQLIDPRSHALRIEVQRGFGQPFINFFDRVGEDHPSACAGAMSSKAPVIVPDISASPIFQGRASLAILAEEGIAAVVSIPLVSSKDDLLGVLSVHFAKPHVPETRQLHFLELLARIAADYLQRRRAEDTEHLLLREVQHRSNNLLSVVNAVAKKSLAAADYRILETRLHALARANHLANNGAAISVRDSVRGQLESFEGRIAMDGPRIMLSPQEAQDIGLIVHELATNAAKYGALSNAKGRVRLDWTCADSTLSMSWQEEDGPRVSAPLRAGFGTKLLAALSPKAEIDYRPDGLHCRIELAVASP
jgi:PAS domain S-box-containing protein